MRPDVIRPVAASGSHVEASECGADRFVEPVDVTEFDVLNAAYLEGSCEHGPHILGAVSGQLRHRDRRSIAVLLEQRASVEPIPAAAIVRRP